MEQSGLKLAPKCCRQWLYLQCHNASTKDTNLVMLGGKSFRLGKEGRGDEKEDKTFISGPI